VAFAMNYWQITASRVQNNAPGQPASRPAQTKGEKGDAPVQSQASAGLKTSGSPEQLESEQAPCLRFEELYTQSPEQWPGAKGPASNGSGDGSSRASDKVLRMMQASPNLTMAQMKAILQVDRFE
jgi:hypothetical protein